MSTELKDYIIYTRYSTSDQHSTSTQISAVQKTFTLENGFRYIRSFSDEGVTGSDVKNKMQFRKLLEYIKINSNVKYVMIHHVDRLSRSQHLQGHWLTLIKMQGVEDVYFQSNPDQPYFAKPENKLILAFASFAAEYENWTKSLKISAKMTELKEGRKYIGGSLPFGYTIDKDKNIIIDETQRKYVLVIFEMYLSGFTPMEIIRYLNAKEITKTIWQKQRSKNFNISVIRDLLKNEMYKGIIFLRTADPNKKSKKRLKEPIFFEELKILSDETINRIESKLLKNKSIYAQRNSSKNKHGALLKKVIRCSCGSKMQIHAKPKSNYYRYLCTEKITRQKSGSEKSNCDLINLKKLDEVVFDNLLFQEYFKDDFEEIIAESYNLYHDEVIDSISDFNLKSLRSNLTIEQKKLRKLDEAYLKEVISIEEFSILRKDIKQQITYLQKQINKIQNYKVMDFETFKKDIIGKIKSYNISNNSQTDEKIYFINEFIDSVEVVDKSNVIINYNFLSKQYVNLSTVSNCREHCDIL